MVKDHETITDYLGGELAHLGSIMKDPTMKVHNLHLRNEGAEKGRRRIKLNLDISFDSVVPMKALIDIKYPGEDNQQMAITVPKRVICRRCGGWSDVDVIIENNCPSCYDKIPDNSVVYGDGVEKGTTWKDVNNQEQQRVGE